MSASKRVFIVEDDFLVAQYLRDLCIKYNTQVIGMAADADTAINGIRDHKPDYVLMDVRLSGGRDGVDVADIVYEEQPKARVIFITADNAPATLARIKKGKPFNVLIKPFNPEDLRAALEA